MNNDDNLHTTKYNNIDPTEFYDTIIDFDSLKEACVTDKGFDVIFSDKGYENYNKRKTQNATIIGVIGNANKGKSYILSLISNEELPRGYSVTTKGISVKYPKIEFRSLIILDSAGSEAPLVKNENMENESSNNIYDIEFVSELARDKIATENFLQEFIYNNSNILLVIVGQLTNDDQKLINRIKLMEGNKKNIFIIHNLMFIETIESAKKIIEDTILKSITFNNLKEINIIGENDDKRNNIYYQESIESMNEKANIIHLIMAKQGSEAGDYYNDSTIQFLRKQIITETFTKNFDIIESFKKYLSMKSGIYLEKPIEIEKIEYDENKRKLKINETREDIIFKKCFINEIGLSNFYGKIIEPSYSYRRYKDRMEILIELPGLISEEVKWKINVGGGNYIFTYFGRIELPVDSNDIILDKNLTEGEFRFQLTFAICDGLITSSKPKVETDKRNGLVTLTYYFAQEDEVEEIILT